MLDSGNRPFLVLSLKLRIYTVPINQEHAEELHSPCLCQQHWYRWPHHIYSSLEPAELQPISALNRVNVNVLQSPSKHRKGQIFKLTECNETASPNQDLTKTHTYLPGVCPDFGNCSDSCVWQSCSGHCSRLDCASQPFCSPCALCSHMLCKFSNRSYSHSSFALLLGETGCWDLYTEPLLSSWMLLASSQSSWTTGGW